MLRKTAGWRVGLIVLGGASIALIEAGGVSNVVSSARVSCGPQLMVYMTLPLWSRGSSSLPVYGLRVGEFRKRPTTPQLVAVAPVQRELLDLQIAARSDVRIEFGRRLVWDIQRGAFGPQSALATLAIGVPIKGARLSEAWNQQPLQPWDPVTSGMSAMTGDPIRTQLVDGERLVILKVVIPSQWAMPDRRAAYVQLGPTIKFVNSQPTEALLPLRSAEAR
jgi:hypothetical protein